MEFIVVKTCAADAHDAIPKTLVSVNIADSLKKLLAAGYKEVADAGVMCVVEKDGVESTLFSSGRVLVKTADSIVAEKTARGIYGAIGK